MNPFDARRFSVIREPADGEGGQRIGGTGTVPFAIPRMRLERRERKWCVPPFDVQESPKATMVLGFSRD